GEKREHGEADVATSGPAAASAAGAEALGAEARSARAEAAASAAVAARSAVGADAVVVVALASRSAALEAGVHGVPHGSPPGGCGGRTSPSRYFTIYR